MRQTTLCALLVTLLATPALSQSSGDKKKDIDAFERQEIVAKAEVDPVSGNLTIDVEATKAVYPNETSILVTLHYIQGLSTEEHRFGIPTENKINGTSRRIASTTVTVRDWRYQARFVLDKYCPPGEYVISGFYRMAAQKRRVRRQFVEEYVPPHERTNPCQFCRLHYGMTKVQISDPKFKLRPSYASMKDAPLWLKQKLDYGDRMISSYKDWYAQILGARDTLRRLSHSIMRLGPTEMAMVDESVARVGPEAQKEMHAIVTWKAVDEGLRQCAAWLKTQPQLPSNPHRYWRLAAFADGVPPEEDMRDPSPERGSRNRPWSRNYIMPRLDYVMGEIMMHNREVAVLILPNTFHELRNYCDRVKHLATRTDQQIDCAVDTLLTQNKFGKLQQATPEERTALSEEMQQIFYSLFHQLHIEKSQAEREMEKELERLQKMLSIDIKFPVATWPIPHSITEPPQNPPEDRKRQIESQFGAFMGEVAPPTGKRRLKDGKK